MGKVEQCRDTLMAFLDKGSVCLLTVERRPSGKNRVRVLWPHVGQNGMAITDITRICATAFELQTDVHGNIMTSEDEYALLEWMVGELGAETYKQVI